ncbi:hypothetical protein pb186bvf_003058 [Paramecium bursaria]
MNKQPVIVPPKYYADVLKLLPQPYWDYENYQIQWGDQDHYDAYRKIGRGKYSEVFEGIDNLDKSKIVIKVLKPIKKAKIKREISILRHLKNGVNIIELKDSVRDPSTKTPSLIFDYIENVDFRSMFPQMIDQDVRYYLFQLLKALDYCHSKGIMHRDVKPQNIIVDPQKKILKLIDWGLAEYFHLGKDYNVRVASRYFKGPELLVDYQYYDYSLDIWSTGAMFASMIFKKEPFFQGKDNYDQLVQIAKVLGYEDLKAYLKRYNLKLDSGYNGLLYNFPKQNWLSFVTNDNQHLCSLDALDLLSKMLVYDHAERITPRDAMEHQYFATLK